VSVVRLPEGLGAIETMQGGMVDLCKRPQTVVIVLTGEGKPFLPPADLEGVSSQA